MTSPSPSYQHQPSMVQDHSNVPSYLLSSLAPSAAAKNHHQQQLSPRPQEQHHRNVLNRDYNDENEWANRVEARLNGFCAPERSQPPPIHDARLSTIPAADHQPPAHRSGMASRFRPGSDYLGAPTHKNLYILNLPLDATTDQLAALFGTFGVVSHCVILAMLDAQARRRGFIDMSSAPEAKAAIEGLNGFVWHGYPIEVSYAIVQRSGGPFEQASGANVIKRNVPRNRFNTGPRRIPSDQIHGFSLQRSGSSNSSGPPSPSCYSDGSGVSSNDSHITSDPCTIFISGLDPVAILDDEDLKHALEPYGRILSGFLSKDDQGISRGFGIVTFSTPEEATRAGLGLDGKVLNGRRISAHNLHYQRDTHAGSPSQTAYSGTKDYFTKMLPTSHSPASTSPRGSFSNQLPSPYSPSNGYPAFPSPVGGRYSPSPISSYLPPHSPQGFSSSLPSSRRLDQIPMGSIGAAPGTYARPSPPSSLGYSGFQSPQPQAQLPSQGQTQQHSFFRSSSGGSLPIEIQPHGGLSGFNGQVKLGDAFVPKGAAALTERLGISKSPEDASALGKSPASHPDAGPASPSSHGAKNERRTSVESHGSSSGSQRSIGSERAASIGSAHSPSNAGNGLSGSLALPWAYSPGSLGMNNLSPASTMSVGSTASSVSNLNTPESGIICPDKGSNSGLGAADQMWGRPAVLISGSANKWSPLNAGPAGHKDLLTGGDIVPRKVEVSLAGPRDFERRPIGQEVVSSSPRRTELKDDRAAFDLSSLGQYL